MGEKEFKGEEFKDLLQNWKHEVRKKHYDPPDLLAFLGSSLFHEVEAYFDDLIRTDGGQGVTLSCTECHFEETPEEFDGNAYNFEFCPECNGQLIYESGGQGADTSMYSEELEGYGKDLISTTEDVAEDILEGDRGDMLITDDDLDTGDFSVGYEGDYETGDLIDAIEDSRDPPKTPSDVDTLSIMGIKLMCEPSLGDWEAVFTPRIESQASLYSYVDILRSFRFPPRAEDPSNPDIIICAECDEKTDDPAIVTETEGFCSIGCYL